jgi:hypothetical protein
VGEAPVGLMLVDGLSPTPAKLHAGRVSEPPRFAPYI